MVARVANFAQQSLLNSQMLRLQDKLFDSQISVTSEKKTQIYSGLKSEVGRVLSLESQITQAERFQRSNDAVTLRLNTIQLSVDGAESAIRNFRDQLSDISSNATPDKEQIQRAQKFAYQALVDIQSYLNTDVDGQYVFGGSRGERQPVDLGLGSNLADFQSTWNGKTITYPTTRDAHLLEFSSSESNIDFDSTTGTITDLKNTTVSKLEIGSKITLSGGTSSDGTWTVASKPSTTSITVKQESIADATATGLNFTYKTDDNVVHTDTGTSTYAAGSITTTDALFTGKEVPFTIVAGGTGGANDGETYTVTAISGTGPQTLTVQTRTLTTATNENGTLTVSNYYGGDTTTKTHRADESRTIDLSLNAIDPAFEKAIRALGIIAQGTYGTEGGLQNNTSRINDALYLLNSSLDFPTSGTAPYGAEETSSIEQIGFDNGFKLKSLADINTRKKSLVGFLEGNVGKIENTDLLTASTLLLDQSRALEASYQVISRTQKLGLTNYL